MPKRITLKGLTVVAASVAPEAPPTQPEATPALEPAPWADFMQETPAPIPAPAAAAPVTGPPAAAATAPVLLAQTATAPVVVVAQPATAPAVMAQPATAPVVVVAQPATAPVVVVAQPATAPVVVAQPATAPVVVAQPATAPVVVAQASRVSVASRPTPAQAQTARVAGEDPSFSDQVMRWMQQGDRLAERPRAPVDLSDLVEPTDPVAHELLDAAVGRPRTTKAQVRRRWMGVGAFVVMSVIGIYWAAQGHGTGVDRPALGGAIAASPSPIERPIPALIPRGAGIPGSPPLAAAEPAPKADSAKSPGAKPAAAVAARDSHRHRRGGGRPHRRR